jgi:hypothetical protein
VTLLDKVLDVIKYQPHGYSCAALPTWKSVRDVDGYKDIEGGSRGPCDCWRSRLIKLISESSSNDSSD